MYIGQLSKRSGASRKAIYLYEELGLIPTPVRQGTYRVYPPEVVGLIQVIRCAQSLGFRLSELAEALRDTTATGLPGPAVLLGHIARKEQALQRQQQAIQCQLDQLQTFGQQVQDMPLSAWRCQENT